MKWSVYIVVSTISCSFNISKLEINSKSRLPIIEFSGIKNFCKSFRFVTCTIKNDKPIDLKSFERIEKNDRLRTKRRNVLNDHLVRKQTEYFEN